MSRQPPWMADPTGGQGKGMPMASGVARTEEVGMRPRNFQGGREAAKSVRLFFAIAVLLAVTPVLPGCGENGGEGRKGTGQSGPQPEKASICALGVASIALAMAQSKGLFEAQGVEVVLKKTSTGTLAMESLYRGECDLATPSETVVVLQSFLRQDFRVLATIASSNNALRILASRKRGIEKPLDLKGKRIFVPKGSVSHFFLETYLAKNGLAETDVEIIQEGVADVTAAFAAGQIDAFCQTDVMVSKPMMALGEDAVVLSQSGLVISSFNLAAMEKVIREKQEALRRVLAAMIENEKAMREVSDDLANTVSAALDIDRRAAEAIVRNYRWKVELSQALLLSLEQEAQWAIDSGYPSRKRLPNYLDYVHREELLSLKPEAVTILP